MYHLASRLLICVVIWIGSGAAVLSAEDSPFIMQHQNPFDGGVLPGEHVQLNTGKLYWEINEVTLPGQGGLNLVLNRSYGKHLGQEPRVLGDWLLELPRIVLSSDKTGRTVGGDTGKGICTNPWPASNRDEIWTGLKLIIPGEAPKPLLFKRKSATQFPSKIKYVTKDNWIAECVHSKRVPGEAGAFLVRSPGGLTYWFDVVGYDPGKKIGASVTTLVLYASRYQDMHSNWIAYDYGFSNVDKGGIRYRRIPYVREITTSDERRVAFTYAENPLEKWQYPRLTRIKAHGRKWYYTYEAVPGNPIAGHLASAILPNRDKWEYPAPEKDWLKVITPTGLSVSYNFAERRAQDFNPIKSRKPTTTVLTKRKISHDNIKTSTWTYSYDVTMNEIVTTVTTPQAEKTFHFTKSLDWQFGLLTQQTTRDKETQTVLRTYKYKWAGLPAIGDEKLPDIYYHQYEPKIPALAHTNIDGRYTTEFRNFDEYGKATKQVETGDDTRITHYQYQHQTKPWLIGLNTQSCIETIGCTRRTYNSAGKLTLLDELGVKTWYQHDNDGNLVTRSWLKDGQQLSSQYRDYYRGVAQTEIHPEGKVISQTVNAFGQMTYQQDARGYGKHIDYDSLGRVSRTQLASGLSITESWPTPSQHIEVRGSITTKTYYNALGLPNKVEKTNGKGSYYFQRWRYDEAGRKLFESIVSTLQDDHRGTNYYYDALGRLISSVQNFGGGSEQFCYDHQCETNEAMPAVKHGVMHRDRRGYKTIHRYRSYGNPDQKSLIALYQQVEGGHTPKYLSTVIHRDKQDNIVKVTQDNYRRRHSYDSQQRLHKTYHPETGWTTFQYDEAGNRISSQTENNDPVTYHYDNLNRLVLIDYPDDTPDTVYAYDLNDNLTNIAHGETEWSYQYNSQNQIIEETLHTGTKQFTIKYDYNINGDLIEMTYPSGQVIDFAPDDLGFATKVGPYLDNITHNTNGKLQSKDFANGIRLYRGFNTNQLPETIRLITPQKRQVFQEQYIYDRNNNITSIQNYTLGTYQQMAYDGLNRFTELKSAGRKHVVNVEYDALGNILTKNTRYDGELTSKTYHYDTKNRLSNISGSQPQVFEYDQYGNVSNNGRLKFHYNAASQLKQVMGAKDITYHYDGHGHRVSSKSPTQSTITLYNKAGHLLYQEDLQTNQITEYIYHDGKIIAEVINPNTPSQTTQYLHTDLLGSVVAISNEQGEITSRQQYHPYGQTITNPATSNQLWFSGKPHDETGLVYLNARYYDPDIGRFLAIDPVGFVEENPQSFNRYLYANNNPYRYTDTSGEFIDFLFDLGSLGMSAYNFATNPSWSSFGGLMFDAVATAVPFMPAGAGYASHAADIGGFFGAMAFKGPGSAVDDSIVGFAKSLQGSGKYPGVDDFKEITLRKGNIVYAGTPNYGNFYTTKRSLAKANGSAEKMFRGLQVQAHEIHGYRKEMTAFEVMFDMPAAYGKIKANIDYGPGGFSQIVIRDYQAGLKPLYSVPLK